MDQFGAISLLPTVIVITMAILTHRPIASLFAGVFAGILLIAPTEIIGRLADLTIQVAQDETIGWVITVCGLMGSLIYVLILTGGASAFANTIAKRANTRKKSLMVTWFLGLMMFIDDYLNAMVVGNAMKKITDKFKISRAMLSYVVDSTAAPTCVIVPISTWAVFFAALLESTNYADTGDGIRLYISAIPFMFYPFIALIIVPLVAMGKFPLLGQMKKAEKLAEQGFKTIEPYKDTEIEQVKNNNLENNMWVFMLPLLALIGFSWYFEIDLLKGLIATLLFTLPILIIRKFITFQQTMNGMIEGFKIMLPPLGIVFVAFMFKTVNDQLGLPQYVIETLQPLMSPLFFPVIVFVAMAFISFGTGSTWGIYAIAIPIVMPLGIAMEIPIPLIIGALLSASSFGSHACFYGDATVLSAQSSGIGVVEHALTQLPYALIAAFMTCVAYVTYMTIV